MELQQFIEEALVGICSGIAGANARLKKSGGSGVVNPPHIYPFNQDNQAFGAVNDQHAYRPLVHLVKFNVAVYAKDEKGTKAGIGIVVGAVALGSQGKTEQSASNESRIEFSIPVVLPTGDKVS